MQPAILAAIIAGSVAGFGILANFAGGLFLQWRRQIFDREIGERRLSGDLALAREKHGLDRRLEAWRRRGAFAEETLEEFYEVQSLFKLFRSGLSFREEAETRQGRADEAEDLRQARDNYWPVLKRMNDNIEPFSKLHARRFRAALLFGTDAQAPFAEIRMLHARLQTAGQALMREMTHSGMGTSPAFKEKMEQVVWEGLTDPDPFTVEIDAAVAKAEATFGGILNIDDVVDGSPVLVD